MKSALEIFCTFGFSFIRQTFAFILIVPAEIAHYIGIEMALEPLLYDGYILVKSFSLFIAYVTKIWEKEI